MGWADDQIKEDQKDKESQAISDDLRLREEQLKDDVGRDCFEALKAYVKSQIERYNGSPSTSPTDRLLFIPDSSSAEEQDIMSKIPSFTIRKQDGRCAYVYVSYRQHGHQLRWKCGDSRGHYELRTHPDGSGYFLGGDGRPLSPQEAGDELLTMARKAEPASGGPWR